MKLLLDTHAFLWFVGGDDALSSRGRLAIEDFENHKLVSMVSLWEIAIKNSIGKLDLEKPFEQLIPEQLQASGFEVLGMSIEHLTMLTQRPLHHRDPFDRLLVAQCLAENLTLLSGDEALDAYGIHRLW